MLEELSLLFFLILTILIGVVLFGLSFITVPKNFNLEKISAYECGFQPFISAISFEVKYYIVALLFLIFDLEVVILMPFTVSVGLIGIFGYTVMLIFFLILTIGFIYEWAIGGLEWN